MVWEGGITQDQKEKEDAARVARQRPILRVCAELGLVGIIRDRERDKEKEREREKGSQGNKFRSGGEWVMKALKDLVR